MKPRLTDNELIKWCKILGCKKILWLEIEDRIFLTSRQIDMVINMKHGEDYEPNTYSIRPRRKYVTTKNKYVNKPYKSSRQKYTFYEKEKKEEE